MTDSFGDRMKLYEGMEADRRCLPYLPVMARLDGKAFHSYTRQLNRPYDEAFVRSMIGTTQFLVSETNACMGYTQSDEISLAWYNNEPKSQIWFDGRIQKMCSVLAAMATYHFNQAMSLSPSLVGKLDRPGYFDCRVWAVPNLVEGANVFLWRELDATRNSIQMAGQKQYSHAQLYNKSCDQIQEMLHQKGINWNDYPAFFKRGTFIQRVKVRRTYSSEELEKLPANHAARKNPDLEIERHTVRCLDMPPFSRVANRPEVVFFGDTPILHSEE